MSRKYLFLIGIIFLAFQIVQISSKIELTNMKCIPLDKEFADFETCRLRSVNRTYKYMSLKVNLFKVPVTNISINVALLKRFNYYRPFLYNVTFDACRFMASKNRNSLLSILYGFISENSNINHTCPLNHDVIVDKLTIEFINNRITKMMPIPSGDYAVYTSWYAYGINRADVRVFGTFS